MINIRKLLGAALASALVLAAGTSTLAFEGPDAARTEPITLERSETGTFTLRGITATAEGTSIGQVRQQLVLPDGWTLVFLDDSGEDLAETELVATGTDCQLCSDADAKSAPVDVVVRGDVVGSGKIGLSQLVRLAHALSDPQAIEGVFLAAGDWNGSGKIDLSDLVQEAQAVRGGNSEPDPSPSHGTDLASMQGDALLAANDLRAKSQIPPLATVDGLNQAAQVRATEMAAWQRAATTRPDGSHHSTVLSTDGDIRSYAVSYSAAPEEAVSYLAETIWGRGGYMGNMVTDVDYSYFGFGIAQDTQGKWYVCQILSTSPTVHSVGEPILPISGGNDSTSVPDHPDPDYTSQPIPDGARLLVEAGVSVLGKPYEYGASGPDAFDCSGFVHYALQAAGVEIGRMGSVGYAEVPEWQTIENKDELRTGDLVFFISGSGTTINHMGIYMGNGNFLHAASSAGGVGWRSMATGSYANAFVLGKRVFA